MLTSFLFVILFGLGDLFSLGTLPGTTEERAMFRQRNRGVGVVVALLAILVLGGFVFGSSDGCYGVYSEGYRMGKLDKASVKGLVNSCEAQLLLGRESTPYVKTTGSGDDKTQTTINPWYFSGSEDGCEELMGYGGKYVWIRYEQYRSTNVFTRDTDYNWREVQPVTKRAPSKSSYATAEPKGWKSDGYRFGRIVKASYKGNVFGTWEIMLQVGDSGAQFKNMSITDEDMYNYALEVLKAGVPVKISYNESFIRNPAARDTTYQVWRIEVVGKDEISKNPEEEDL